MTTDSICVPAVCHRRTGAWGKSLHGAVAVIVTALLVDTWGVEGLWTPVMVASGSMAPALLGPHAEWKCVACEQRFVCDLESIPAAGRPAVCPLCGEANDVADGTAHQGDRVLIDRAAFLWRAPRRFEMVVAQNPDDPSSLCVKRVVGLPGEAVRIADGEVWRDGQLIRKPAADQRGMAVAVCDPVTNTADSDRQSSWNDDGGFWHRNANECVFTEPASARTSACDKLVDRAPVHWLTYRHGAMTSTGLPSGSREILDDSAYDQSESRRLNPVSDVMVRGAFSMGTSGSLQLRLVSEGDEFIATLTFPSGEARLSRNGSLVQANKQTSITYDYRSTFEWGSVDRQVRLGVNGRTVLEYAYEPSAGEPRGGPSLAIGGQQGTVTIADLRVLRDVYYIEPPDGRESRLAAGEYFLLGDNSAHSRDSRHWPSGGAVPAAWIVGKAIRW